MNKVSTWIKAHIKIILIALVVLHLITSIYQCGQKRELDHQAKALIKEVRVLKAEAAKKDATYQEAMSKKKKEIAEQKQKAADIEAQAKTKITAVNKIAFRSAAELTRANATVTEFKLSLETAERAIAGWKTVVDDLNKTVDAHKGVIARLDEALRLAQADIVRVTEERDAAIKKAEEMYELYKRARKGSVVKILIAAGITLVIGKAL